MIPDWKIRELEFITPFTQNEQDRTNQLGTGLSSYGYDLKLSSVEFLVFRAKSSLDNSVIDPKDFNKGQFLEEAKLYKGEYQDSFFILPPYSTGLGVAEEYMDVPSYLTGNVVGKSTYARCGVICPITPIEAGWKGYLTIELFNSTGFPVKVYANEGVCQVLFYETLEETCEKDYSQRKGKYNQQGKSVVLPRINKNKL